MKDIIKELNKFEVNIQKSIKRVDLKYLAGLPSIAIENIYSLDTIPQISCVYFVINSTYDLLYIGKSKNLNRRWKRHHTSQGFIQEEHSMFFHAMEISGKTTLHWLEIDPDSAVILEILLIRFLEPLFNVVGNPNCRPYKIYENDHFEKQHAQVERLIGKKVFIPRKSHGVITGVYHSNKNVYDVQIKWDKDHPDLLEYYPKYDFWDRIKFYIG